MYITLEADYALRIVHTLASSEDRMDAKAISEKTGVTLRFSLKILRKLVPTGMVKSYRGFAGGYEIAKPPEEITVYDVLSQIEGPLTLNRCVLEDSECTRVPDKNCPYHYLFKHVTDQIKAQLSSVTIADVLKGVKEDQPLLPL